MLVKSISLIAIMAFYCIAVRSGESRHHKVVVIGAGVAGCTAAKTLVDAGINDIVVLEASDRIGGRVKTVKAENGYNLEYGAHWVHGDQRNPLYTALNRLNLIEFRGEYAYQESEDEGDFKYFTADKQEITPSILGVGYRIYDMVSERIENLWDPEDISIEEFKKREFIKICNQLRVPQSRRGLQASITAFLDKVYAADDGLWPNDRSQLINADVYDDNGGKDYVFKNGTFSLFERLLLPKIRSYIELRKEVQKIIWSNDTVSVITSNGTYTADHVIITPSLGYMKQNHLSLFTPILPADKHKAIESLAFGKVEKLLLLCNEPFWAQELADDENFQGYAFVYKNSEVARLSASIRTILQSNETWWQQLSYLAVSTTNPNLLTVFMTGEPSVQMQKYDVEKIKRVLFEILKYFTGIVVDKPCTLVRTSWSKEKYILGSYSSVTKDYKRSYTQSMLRPLYREGKPVALFAGEAYHPSFMSAMHGAFETGRQQAGVIINYNQEK